MSKPEPEQPKPKPDPKSVIVQGDVVHDVESRGGANASGDGIVIGRHDDGTVTVARFATVERVAVESLRLGASTSYDPASD